MNFDSPHRRFNPLNGQWVMVSPHRARRPWQGQMEKTPPENLLPYDPTCYLCPGNARNTGPQNPSYTGTYVFDNDFPALLLPDEMAGSSSGIFRAESEYGICRVVCFSPRHDLTLPQMDQAGVEQVVRTWTEQSVELCHRDFIRYVQVFENKGAMMGCSNPHPHSQVWATGQIPNEPAIEAARQEAYLKEHGRCLLCETLQAEQADGRRVVAANEYFLAVVPFWAVWPFEVLLLSRRHLGKLADLNSAEVGGLADIMRQVTVRYDNLFEISFPYSMGFHQTPCDGGVYPGWHFHAHYYPPLLRSATVRKFMVGFELLAMAQRDLTPETAAERLRSVSDIHYKVSLG